MDPGYRLTQIEKMAVRDGFWFVNHEPSTFTNSFMNHEPSTFTYSPMKQTILWFMLFMSPAWVRYVSLTVKLQLTLLPTPPLSFAKIGFGMSEL